MTIVITAGGTTEKIDGVRKISNISTGKLGTIILEKIVEKFKKETKLCIYYLSPRNSIKPKNIDESKIIYLDTESIEQVEFALNKIFETNQVDWFIHSMAVSDYSIKNIVNKEDIIRYLRTNISLLQKSEEIEKIINMAFEHSHNYYYDNKISSKNEEMFITLKKTSPILEKIKFISPLTKLISFKLFSGVSKEELKKEGFDQLIKTNSEYVIASDIKDIKTGLPISLLINKTGNTIDIKSKQEIAENIIEIINDYYNEEKILKK